MSNHNQLTEKKQVFLGIAIIGIVFFIIGFVSWVNSILIPYFKIAYSLSGNVDPCRLPLKKYRL